MAATITANPNPVLFTWPRLVVAGTSTMMTTTTWDIDSNAQGEVFVTRDGGQNRRSQGARNWATEGARQRRTSSSARPSSSG